MVKVFFSIFITVLVTQTKAFASKIDVESVPINIIGGKPAPLGSVPYQVSLLDGGVNGSHSCGGSIINENYVLTAAHCTSGLDPVDLGVRAGFNTIDAPEPGYQTVAVAEIINHENYSDITLQNDIAILRLATSLKLDKSLRTASIKVPAAGYAASGNVTVTGWGLTMEGGVAAENKLQTVTILVVSDDQCRETYGASTIIDSMICAGLSEGGKDACQMDSGGPLVEESSGLLVGVVSNGLGCGRPGIPGVYTETSYYTKWFERHIK